MARQKTGRPRGRPSTVAAGAPTVAEKDALAAIAALQAELGKAPTASDIARHCKWSRQRASTVVKRLEDKGLIARAAGATAGGGIVVAAPNQE